MDTPAITSVVDVDVALRKALRQCVISRVEAGMFDMLHPEILDSDKEKQAVIDKLTDIFYQHHLEMVKMGVRKYENIPKMVSLGSSDSLKNRQDRQSRSTKHTFGSKK